MAGLILNSLLVAAGAALVAVLAGLAVATASAGAGPWARMGWLAAAGATLALPPFLVANSWLESTSAWRTALGGDAAALAMRPVTAAVLGWMLWPVPYALVSAGWSGLQRGQFEVDPLLRGWPMVRHWLLPAAAPGLKLGALLTFVLALANFTVPTLFQVRVFTEEFWIRFNTEGDPVRALHATWPMLLAPALLAVGGRTRAAEWPRWSLRFPGDVFRRHLGRAGFALAAVIAVFSVALSLVFPVMTLLLNPRTWTEFSGAFDANREVATTTFLTGFAATVVAVVAALAASLAGERRITNRSANPLSTALRAAVWLPFLLPGVATGLVLIWAFNRPLTEWLYQSPGILVVAFALRYAGPAWTGARAACDSVDRSLPEALTLAGAGRWHRFFLGTWPQIRAGIAATAYVVFLLGLWDVETAVLIQPPGGQTLALRIFNLLHYGHSTQVNALCLIVMALALLPLLLPAALAGLGALRRTTRFQRAPAPAALVLLCLLLLLPGCRPPSDTVGAPVTSKFFSRVEVLGSRGVAPGQFTKPRSLVCDRDDNLYVSDMTGRVQKFDRDGHYVLQWQMPQTDLGKPKGLGLDRDGNILVLEPHYQRVNHFDTSGHLLRQWGRRGTNDGEFILPRGIVQNTRGEFYLCEYTVMERVQRFSPDRLPSAAEPFDATRHRPVSVWGAPGTGPGEFNRAESLCLGPGESVYIADSCNHRIQVFDPAGKFLRTYGKAGSNAGDFSYPYDIKVDALGQQYVCEFGNSRISVFDPQDRLLEVIGKAGRLPGEFFNPWSIAFDSKGNLYVADSQNHRVQKLIRRR